MDSFFSEYNIIHSYTVLNCIIVYSRAIGRKLEQILVELFLYRSVLSLITHVVIVTCTQKAMRKYCMVPQCNNYDLNLPYFRMHEYIIDELPRIFRKHGNAHVLLYRLTLDNDIALLLPVLVFVDD